MDHVPVFGIAAAGMAAERARVDAAAMNLAHANTVVTPAGTYQPVRAVLRAGFAAAIGGAAPLPVPVAATEALPAKPRLVPDPGHPAANAEGFVAYVGVDPAAEMMTLMSALRSYEANVAAMNSARALVLKTLEIGRAP